MSLMIAILIITISIFIRGKFTANVITVLTVLSLFIFGILDLTETISGFYNPTIIITLIVFIAAYTINISSLKFKNTVANSVSSILLTPISITNNKMVITGDQYKSDKLFKSRRTTASTLLNHNINISAINLAILNRRSN